MPGQAVRQTQADKQGKLGLEELRKGNWRQDHGRSDNRDGVAYLSKG